MISCITSCSWSLSGKWSIHPKKKNIIKNGTKVFLLLFSICKIMINSNWMVKISHQFLPKTKEKKRYIPCSNSFPDITSEEKLIDSFFIYIIIRVMLSHNFRSKISSLPFPNRFWFFDAVIFLFITTPAVSTWYLKRICCVRPTAIPLLLASSSCTWWTGSTATPR